MPKTTTAELVGSAEAAALLHLDRSTLSRWVTKGKITPALRGAGATGEKFFALRDIEKILAAQKTESAA